MRPGRSGFTLVEAAVATLLTLMLLAVVGVMTRYGARSIGGAEGHLEAVHAAMGCLERVEADLDRLLVRSAADLAVFDGRFLEAGQSLELTVAMPGPGKQEPVYAGQPVRYTAQPASDGLFTLTRDGRAIPGCRFRRIEFEAREHPGLDPARPLHLVRTRLVGAGTTGQEFLLESLTAVDAVSEWSRARGFNPNPDRTWPALAFTSL